MLYDTFFKPVNDHFDLGVSYPGPYIPFHYTADRRTGDRTYLQELLETHIACSIIDHLLDQSPDDTCPDLSCPFCGAYHHPYKAKCIRVGAPNEGARSWANATAWEDYFIKTAPFCKSFATATVPGEAELEAYRRNRSPEAI